MIEQFLAKTEYQKWTHIGAERNWYYPLIDFVSKDGKTVIGLRSLNTARKTDWLPEYRNYIDQWAASTDQVVTSAKTKILEIRIQPGVMNAETQKKLNELRAYAAHVKDTDGLDLTIDVKEF